VIQDLLGQVVETLLNELYETVTEEFVIVLNDYHAVESPRINAVVVRLLRYLPDNCQLVVLSREVPALDLPQLAARREVAGLGVAELRFTAAEAEAFVRQSGGGALTAAEAEELVQRFDGWITGVILGTQVLGRELGGGVGHGDAEHVFAYLAREVVERQAEEVQRFLEESAVLPRMSVPWCNAVLGRTDAQELLSLVEAKGLFVERVGGRGEWKGEREVWYRYHPLFRDFLRQRLQGRDEERWRRLNERAAEVLEGAGEGEEAVGYYLTAGAYERAAEVIEEIWREWMALGRLDRCAEWLAALPAALVAERVGLLLLRARICCWQGRTGEAVTVARQAEALCIRRQDYLALVGVLLEQYLIWYWSGRFAETIPLCKRALEILAGLSADEAARAAHGLLIAQVHRHLGLAFYHCGEVEAAHKEFLRALEFYHNLGDMAGIALVHSNLGMSLRALAEDSAAEYHLREAIRVWAQVGPHRAERQIPLVLNDLAVLYQDQGRYEEAIAMLREALSMIERTNDRYARAYIVGTMADIQRDMGQGAQAGATYLEAWDIAEHVHEAHLSFWIAQGCAQNRARRGELELAREFLAQAMRYLPGEERGHAWGMLYLTQGIIARQAGDLREAIAAVQRAQELLFQSGWRRAWCQATVTLAVLRWCQGDKNEALSVLAGLLGQLDPARLSPSLRMVFLSEGRELLPILRQMIVHPEERRDDQCKRAEKLISWLQEQRTITDGDDQHGWGQYAVQPPVDRVTTSSSAGTLVVATPDMPAQTRELYHIFALGEPRVYRGERLITEWRSAKALEVLLYFVEGRGPQRKEVVLEALWPDVPVQRADVLFRSTMYRLRHAIGQEGIVYQRGVYVLALTYRYDVREFEDALAEGQRLEGEAAAAAYRRAIALYGGDYCEPVYADWCMERRDALRQGYIQALLWLARAEWVAGRWEESAELWQRAVSADPCVEEGHRGLITYYAARGQRVLAVRQYQRCVRALEELGVPPEAETVAAYRRAIAQESALRPR